MVKVQERRRKLVKEWWRADGNTDRQNKDQRLNKVLKRCLADLVQLIHSDATPETDVDDESQVWRVSYREPTC